MNSFHEELYQHLEGSGHPRPHPCIDKPPVGYIEWAGGDSPVSDITWVNLVMRDGSRMDAVITDRLMWSHLNAGDDIMAYRVLTPAETEHLAAASSSGLGMMFICTGLLFAALAALSWLDSHRALWESWISHLK